jgi:DNA-binding PadR family transcriptional regulator
MTQGEIIILRLLDRRSYYGYELDKIIEENHMRRWADIGFSSIYNLLGRLEKKGFVTARFEKVHGSPKRKVYEITETGRAALRKEVTRMLEQPADVHDDFTVGVVVSDVLADEDFRRALRGYRNHLEARKEFIETSMPDPVKQKPRVLLAFERLRRMLDAEIRWIDENL